MDGKALPAQYNIGDEQCLTQVRLDFVVNAIKFVGAHLGQRGKDHFEARVCATGSGEPARSVRADL